MVFIAIGRIREACAHRYPESNPIHYGETLFVHPDVVSEFVKTSLPTLTVPFVLVTGCSDYTIPFHFPKETTILLKNPLVLKWFAQNCAMKVGKLEYLPIGLDYKILTTNEHEISVLPLEPPRIAIHLGNIDDDSIEVLRTVEKKSVCYGNFHFFTDTLYGSDRNEASLKIPPELIEFEEKRLSRSEMCHKMAQYKYVVSPFGNGLDCHRTWEALALGCIPIVRSSGLNPLFEGLPVLIVNDWSEITRELLNSFIPDVSQIEKIKLEYWLNRLNSYLDSQITNE
jgi:hypothetical protein